MKIMALILFTIIPMNANAEQYWCCKKQEYVCGGGTKECPSIGHGWTDLCLADKVNRMRDCPIEYEYLPTKNPIRQIECGDDCNKDGVIDATTTKTISTITSIGRGMK